jgi:hypothetical protein
MFQLHAFLENCYEEQVLIDTALLQHHFHREIALLMPKFSDRFEILGRTDGFFNESEFLDLSPAADPKCELFRWEADPISRLAPEVTQSGNS